MDDRSSPQLAQLELVTPSLAAAATAAISSKPRRARLPATLIKRDRPFLPSISTFPYHPFGRIARLARRVRTRWPRSTERARNRRPPPAFAPEQHKEQQPDQPAANADTVAAPTAPTALAAGSNGDAQHHRHSASGPRPGPANPPRRAERGRGRVAVPRAGLEPGL